MLRVQLLLFAIVLTTSARREKSSLDSFLSMEDKERIFDSSSRNYLREESSELTFPTVKNLPSFRFENVIREEVGKGGKKEGKIGAEVKDPCAPVKDKKSGRTTIAKGCDPPPGVCPGEQNPKKPGEYLINNKFVKPKKGEVVQPCSGHGRAMRNGANCDCVCEEGWGGGTPKNCSMRWREALVVDIPCADMPDPYFMICHDIMHTICKPYSLAWRFECERTCQAIVGKSCLKEKIVQHCSHDPECPYMCFKMMDENCKAQEAKMLRLIPGLDPVQQRKGEMDKKSQSTSGGSSVGDDATTEEDNPCRKITKQDECVKKSDICEWDVDGCWDIEDEGHGAT